MPLTTIQLAVERLAVIKACADIAWRQGSRAASNGAALQIEEAALRRTIRRTFERGWCFITSLLYVDAEGAKMQQTFSIHCERQRRKQRRQLSGRRSHDSALAVGINYAHAGRRALDHYKNPVAAINSDPGYLPEAGQARLPLSRRTETMNAAIRAVSDVNAPATIERQIIRLPRVGQLRIRLLIGRRRRAPMAAQRESV